MIEKDFWWQPAATEGATIRFDNEEEMEVFCEEHFLCFECYKKTDDEGLYLVYPTLSKIVERHNKHYGT